MSVLDTKVMDRWVEEDTVVDMNVDEVACMYQRSLIKTTFFATHSLVKTHAIFLLCVGIHSLL